MGDELKQALKKFFYDYMDRGGESEPKEREAFREVLKASMIKASEPYVRLKIRELNVEPELRAGTFDDLMSGMDENIESISNGAAQVVEADFDKLIERIERHTSNLARPDLGAWTEGVYRKTLSNYDEFFSEFVDTYIKRVPGEE